MTKHNKKLVAYRGKLTHEHFQRLEELLLPILKENLTSIEARVTHSGKYKDFPTAVVFVAFYSTDSDSCYQLMREIYKYGNDNHLTTALLFIYDKYKLGGYDA